MKKVLLVSVLIFLMGFNASFSQIDKGYDNFEVSVYARSYEVRQMDDLKWLEPIWDMISNQVHVDKIYLETHRDMVIVDEKTLEKVKKFFNSRGVKTAGGITLTVSEMNRFETYCYSNPEHRRKVKEIIELTARHFDEIILDDFFFTDCKCELCIRDKGEMSWTDFRLKQMTEAAQNLIIGPAKAVNPKVKVVVKYPNWYEHFQGLGFNLETEPPLFDGIYTGTETRNANAPGQHLQPYLGYQIFRYFENIKPGGNGGGWVDTGGMTFMDRYAEQLWLTLFAKAPEITLFDFRQMQRTLRPADRAPWQDQKPVFDYDEMIKPYTLSNGKQITPTTVARAAGYTFDKVDGFLGKLGKPLGIQGYRPYHSTGEDFLHNYLGMIGLPMDLKPEFPDDPKMILLTESAKFDPDIVKKIKSRLMAGKDVTITSGLLRALSGKGIEDIIELEYTDRKALVTDFSAGMFGSANKASKEILIPQIMYLTNDSWTDVEALGGPVGWPLLHQGRYGKASLFVLTIPDSFGDLYALPEGVLNRIRDVLSPDLKFRIEGPSMVSLFVYDNNTLIVESFLDEETKVKVIAGSGITKMTDIVSGAVIASGSKASSMVWGRERSEGTSFDITVKPHSFVVLKAE
ncbi:MAG: hypothetical protein RBS38_04270 [Bacteroidales bacterium]|jgi:hypothetical protein|nr:hypothetical protein [Bacteroidales bacterium]